MKVLHVCGLSPIGTKFNHNIGQHCYLVPSEFFYIILYYFLNGKGKKCSRKSPVEWLTILIIWNQL